ncbi:hypothetical protein COT68_00005 [bacterium (Candidatus Torokbacteria) CG09_land_8_20_14_0_10_42_11]|nr:MAG: hypothetical protein COT68_00005 [bacterium (Candidatus Torokbacteria) CG09_land_8_20_14_0_10_42_11]
MTITCKIIPCAKQNKIISQGDHFKIYLTAPAREGRANQALIKMLANYFAIAKNRIQILRGEKGREKIVFVDK